MGAWYLSLAGSMFLVLIGMYIHWTVVVFGLILPCIPILSVLVARRKARRLMVADPERGEGSPADEQP